MTACVSLKCERNVFKALYLASSFNYGDKCMLQLVTFRDGNRGCFALTTLLYLLAVFSFTGWCVVYWQVIWITLVDWESMQKRRWRWLNFFVLHAVRWFSQQTKSRWHRCQKSVGEGKWKSGLREIAWFMWCIGWMAYLPFTPSFH